MVGGAHAGGLTLPDVSQVRRMDDVCLVNHAPSPQLCARDGEVWDDTLAATSRHMGGRCLEAATANSMLLNQPDVLEMVHVNITHDTLNSECSCA